ncbi:MAG: enoyl-CoA hydratase [Chloroflexi bacterium]|jgi:enoyl-CoA hydratase|nr:enoyl-CoA hydratase [Chloroflexota bacterium]MBT6682534.1 enoyl-CoA hydratase [Chloroflexota bacterium]
MPPSDYTQIIYEQHDRVAKIVLNRPRYRNAQSRLLLEELDHAFGYAAEDDSIGAIVLAGAGDHFSAGHDLGTPEELADREERPYEEGLRGKYRRGFDQNIDMSLRWRNLPKPTVAAVQGYCIFAGWIISSAMDVVFAAEDAMFLPANFQYFSVPWEMHHRKAREILFESRFVDAQEALELGYVNQVFSKDRLEEESMAYAARVAANDPFQLRMIKLAINQMQDAQGFSQHIQGAFPLYNLSSIGESDPGYTLETPDGRRRPMVQRAFDNYEARQKSGQNG